MIKGAVIGATKGLIAALYFPKTQYDEWEQWDKYKTFDDNEVECIKALRHCETLSYQSGYYNRYLLSPEELAFCAKQENLTEQLADYNKWVGKVLVNNIEEPYNGRILPLSVTKGGEQKICSIKTLAEQINTCKSSGLPTPYKAEEINIFQFPLQIYQFIQSVRSLFNADKLKKRAEEILAQQQPKKTPSSIVTPSQIGIYSDRATERTSVIEEEEDVVTFIPKPSAPPLSPK